MLANSKEQIFIEKMGSLLKHGIRSTRFRDIYDRYYLGHCRDFDQQKLVRFIDVAIVDNPNMREKNFADISSRLHRTLDDRGFRSRMQKSHRDWVGEPASEVAAWLPRFIERIGD